MPVTLHKPKSNVTELFRIDPDAPEQRFQFLSSPASAGFPSPAGDYLEGSLDLNEYLVRNKPASFFFRFGGDSLEGLAILDGDIGCCDRSVVASVGRLVIASIDGEIVAKILEYHAGRPALVSCNDRIKYPPLELEKSHECTIWGCVTGIVRRL